MGPTPTISQRRQDIKKQIVDLERCLTTIDSTLSGYIPLVGLVVYHWILYWLIQVNLVLYLAEGLIMFFILHRSLNIKDDDTYWDIAQGLLALPAAFYAIILVSPLNKTPCQVHLFIFQTARDYLFVFLILAQATILLCHPLSCYVKIKNLEKNCKQLEIEEQKEKQWLEILKAEIKECLKDEREVAPAN